MIKQILNFSILLFLTACAEQKTTNNEKLNSLFDKTSQHFDLLDNDSIVGKEGTILFINPKDLITKSGETVKGKVEITLKEFYKKSDILGMNLSTLSQGQLLETGGMIEVNAFSNNQELELKKDANIMIKFPTFDIAKGMELFNGKIEGGTTNWLPKQKKEINSAGFFMQEEAYESVLKETVIDATYEMVNYYFLESTKLGWINCDRFYKLKNVTDIYVKADTVGRPLISIVFTDINAIMPGYYEENKYTFNKIPVGSIVNCIGMKKIDGKFFYADETFKIEPNLEIELKFKELSEDELKEEIEHLNN